MTAPTRHQVAWVAAGLRRAASGLGVELPADYARQIAAQNLARSEQAGVTRLGRGVVLHTIPDNDRALPIVIGYADDRGQWYRDGRRHQPTAAEDGPWVKQGPDFDVSA